MYRYIPGEPPLTVEALAARYRRTSAGPVDPAERWYNWAVALSAEPLRPFGTVELTLEAAGRRALLGYVFGRASWGLGYAREACAAVLAFAGARTAAPNVLAFIDTRNERSIALAERLGFTREATLRDADYFKGATSHEYRYCYALLRDEHGENK